MLKLVSKFAMDILPSVIATIVGAYIVNHYINVKPAADAAVTAAAVSTADPKKSHSRGDSKPVEKSADLGNIPEPGVRAKGISEKSIIDKSTAEKPVEKPADKADRPAETASIPPIAPASAPAETRRHQPREKAAVRTAPAVPASQPSAPAEPVVAAPNTVAPAETAATPDANDLARAAIERLRGAPEASPRAQEAARIPEAPHVVAAPAPQQVQFPPVQPLPPPIQVSTPPADTFGPGPSPAKPPYPSTARVDDPRRPTPPADIPDPRPLDLRADAVDSPAREHTTVAEDVLSAAKSVFHSVLPK
jgi:hypothetical protein